MKNKICKHDYCITFFKNVQVEIKNKKLKEEKIMQKIGEAEDFMDYEEQFDYLDEILETLENLQLLYGEDEMFKEEYDEIGDEMAYIDNIKDQLKEEMQENEERFNKEYDEEMKAMNAEFERSRL